MAMTNPTTSPGRKCSRGGKAGSRTNQGSSISIDSSSSQDDSFRTGSSFLGARLPKNSAEMAEGASIESMTGAISPTQGPLGVWTRGGPLGVWTRGGPLGVWTRGSLVAVWMRGTSARVIPARALTRGRSRGRHTRVRSQSPASLAPNVIGS